MLRDQDTYFILAATRGRGSLPIAELVKIHEDQGGLQPDRSAGDILEAVKQGYLAATVTLTPNGEEYLKKAKG